MDCEYQVGNEDEDPRVKLDRLEQGMATLKSMVSKLLEAQCNEIPSIELGHGEPKREEKKPKEEWKVEPDMGECSYSRTHVPFRVGAKVEIKTHAREVDAIKMN